MSIKRYKKFLEDSNSTGSTSGMSDVSSSQVGSSLPSSIEGSGDISFTKKTSVRRKKGNASQVSDLRDLKPEKTNKIAESVELKSNDYFKNRKYLDWDSNLIKLCLSKIPNSTISFLDFGFLYTEGVVLKNIDDDYEFDISNIDDDIQLSPSFLFNINISDDSKTDRNLVESDGVQEIISGCFLNWDYFASIIDNINKTLKELDDDFYIFFDINAFTGQKSQNRLKYDFLIELTMKDKFDKSYIIGA